jgi:hypothetical protein
MAAIVQSLQGGFVPSSAPASVLSNWSYNMEVPQTGDERVHLNQHLEADFGGAGRTGETCDGVGHR